MVTPSVEERQLVETVAASSLYGQIDKGDVVCPWDEAQRTSHDENKALEAVDRHGGYHNTSRQQHCKNNTLHN